MVSAQLWGLIGAVAVAIVGLAKAVLALKTEILHNRIVTTRVGDQVATVAAVVSARPNGLDGQPVERRGSFTPLVVPPSKSG